MIAVQDVYTDVSNLLSGSQELLSEFSMFLPEVIRCSINSQPGEIRSDNVEAWVSEAVRIPRRRRRRRRSLSVQISSTTMGRS